MFRYERVNSTKKFTIVAEIVSLLKKIYKRDAPFRAVFKVKTLAVMFPPYPREMKTNTAKQICRHSVACFFLWKWKPVPTRALSHKRGLSMRTHLTAVGLWPGPIPEVRDSRTYVSLCMLIVKSDKSDWSRSQSIVFKKPFRTGISLDLSRGRDSWC